MERMNLRSASPLRWGPPSPHLCGTRGVDKEKGGRPPRRSACAAALPVSGEMGREGEKEKRLPGLTRAGDGMALYVPPPMRSG